MIKLTMNGDYNWSLCRIPDKVLYKKEFKKRHHITSDWLKDIPITSPEEIERISRSRTKSRIKELALNNDFQYFGTVTVNSMNNRFALDDLQHTMRELCRKLKRKNKDFKYLFITEKHKDGAFHFHGLFKNFPEGDLYTNKYGYLNSHIFDELGYNSFDKIKDYVACCHYITKYITKDCVKNENDQIYFCSKGLKSAAFEYMVDYDLEKIFLNKKVFTNNYCQKIDFDISRLNSIHARNLNNFFKYNDEIFNNYDNSITNWLKLLTNYNKKINIKT